MLLQVHSAGFLPFIAIVCGHHASWVSPTLKKITQKIGKIANFLNLVTLTSFETTPCIYANLDKSQNMLS